MGMSFSMSGTTSPRSLMMPGWFVIGKLYDIGSFRLSALFLNTDVEWLFLSPVDSPMGATITSAISRYFTSHYVLWTFSRVNTLFQRIHYLKWWFISSWWFTRQHPGARGISKRCLFAMIFLLQEYGSGSAEVSASRFPEIGVTSTSWLGDQGIGWKWDPIFLAEKSNLML